MPELIPEGPVVMRQRWESLLFLHWRFPAEVLQASLPDGLRVDTFEGNAYVGVVPFLMRKVRPRFLFPVPGISNFLELNLRTYVVDRSGRCGVWFYSLDADQWLAVWIARKLFALPYEHADMSYLKQGDGWECLKSRRKQSPLQEFTYRRSSEPKHSTPSSLCEFLTERYRLYSYKKKNRSLYVGHIHHAPYRVSEVELKSYSKELFALNGLDAPEGAPDHQVLAQPVDVTIYPMEKVVDHG